MKLTPKQELLLEFVKLQHGDQVRKYTGEPYWTHPLAVAELVPESIYLGVEVALCHDLLEDTACISDWLYIQLQQCGYSRVDSDIIRLFVEQLTDKYTVENFPGVNRATRKKAESERLYMFGYEVQTIKYADFINNTSSISEHDPKFAKVYLAEKNYFLSKPCRGDALLHLVCTKQLLACTQALVE